MEQAISTLIDGAIEVGAMIFILYAVCLYITTSPPKRKEWWE